MLNSVIFLSIMGEGVDAKKEEGGREAAMGENQIKSATLEKEMKDFFRDGTTEEDLVLEEERERAERSLIGGCINVQYPNIQYPVSKYPVSKSSTRVSKYLSIQYTRIQYPNIQASSINVQYLSIQVSNIQYPVSMSNICG